MEVPEDHRFIKECLLLKVSTIIIIKGRHNNRVDTILIITTIITVVAVHAVVTVVSDEGGDAEEVVLLDITMVKIKSANFSGHLRDADSGIVADFFMRKEIGGILSFFYSSS